MQGITKQSGSEASLPIIVAAQLYFVDLADFNQLSAHPAFTCYESKTWRALFSARRKKKLFDKVVMDARLGWALFLHQHSTFGGYGPRKQPGPGVGNLQRVKLMALPGQGGLGEGKWTLTP